MSEADVVEKTQVKETKAVEAKAPKADVKETKAAPKKVEEPKVSKKKVKEEKAPKAKKEKSDKPKKTSASKEVAKTAKKKADKAESEKDLKEMAESAKPEVKVESEKPAFAFKLFNKYDMSEVGVNDLSLADYINISSMLVPHSHGRHPKHRFWKRKVNIVERLANKLMVTGHQKAGKKHVWSTRQLTGRKLLILGVIEDALDKVAAKTKKNPVQVLVDATINSAPRAETTAVEYGGVRHPVAVDVAPQRRLDIALSFLAKGAAQKSAKNKTKLKDALADELMLASENDPKSFSVGKKDNLERQAEASK